MYETLVELTIDRKTKNNIDYKQKWVELKFNYREFL